MDLSPYSRPSGICNNHYRFCTGCQFNIGLVCLVHFNDSVQEDFLCRWMGVLYRSLDVRHFYGVDPGEPDIPGNPVGTSNSPPISSFPKPFDFYHFFAMFKKTYVSVPPNSSNGIMTPRFCRNFWWWCQLRLISRITSSKSTCRYYDICYRYSFILVSIGLSDWWYANTYGLYRLYDQWSAWLIGLWQWILWSRLSRR